MSRAFYSEYVNHCLRFYARHQKPTFHSEADKKNWEACEVALREFSTPDREMLLVIYKEGDTIADNVYQMAKSKGIKQDSIWKQVGELERRVAKCRGLL
jgi:hypothetical protein